MGSTFWKQESRFVSVVQNKVSVHCRSTWWSSEGQKTASCCLKNYHYCNRTEQGPTPKEVHVLVKPSVLGGIKSSHSNSAWICKRKHDVPKSSGVPGAESCRACECSEHWIAWILILISGVLSVGQVRQCCGHLRIPAEHTRGIRVWKWVQFTADRTGRHLFLYRQVSMCLAYLEVVG